MIRQEGLQTLEALLHIINFTKEILYNIQFEIKGMLFFTLSN